MAAILLEAEDPDDAAAFGITAKQAANRVLATADRDYRIGLVGAILIGLAFLGKFISHF